MKRCMATIFLTLALACPCRTWAASPLSGAVDAGGGWKYSTWFGCFWPGDPWVYSTDHGWVYLTGSADSMLIWDSKGGWWWTRGTSYPFLYSSDQQSWLWYLKGSRNPRWFYNYSTGRWEDDHAPRVALHFYRR